MNSVLKFLQAARNLSKQGVKKEEILEFAKREFGEITDYMKNAVDDIYSRYAASPLQKILDKRKAVKQSVDERKVLDMEGNVIDPNQPIIGGKQDKISIEGQMEKINKSSNRLDELMKEREAMYKPKKTDDEIVQDLVDEKFGKGYFDTVEKPKFKLNVEKFVQDFPVSKEEAVRISKLPAEEQQKILQDYIDKDFGEQLTLMDFDVTKRKPNSKGGRVKMAKGGLPNILGF